ncbi:heterokaryon incompatibility protein-domain-containing protein [Lasiosphaeria hispida]|uniref:Heterokaryon incompatibility protein-domain-containing protein n=1 Tax=Lasiosphaeria hispida TaxID=260671 RepID=A0AAJ0MA59_9PEZI|nr:heterokaryon incompatibility protein-domain-containing protein [Lasiosphaeria hispida]
MRITTIPIDQALALEVSTVADATRFNIFDTSSTDYCLLDCTAARAKYGLASQRATNGAEKRDKRKGFITFAKNTVQAQRQALQPGEKTPNSTLKIRHDHFTLKELEASSYNGCQSCRFFCVLLDYLFLARPTLDRDGVDLQWVGYSFLLRVQAKGVGQSWTFQFFSPTGARNIIQGLHSANLLNGDTSSTLSFERARRWIDTCQTSHQHCGEGRDVPLPRRVVDLDHLVNLDGQHGVKLVDTDNKRGTYVCLSHCWGKDPMPVRTTLSTLTSHTQFILTSSLPKTFQDAIETTRRLGARYIWIDSLCIIQDCPLDWQIESGKMADIYQNSYITIAAVSSSDFRGGCFSADKTGDACIEFHHEEDGKRTLIAVRECKGTGSLRSQDDSFKAFPLFSRAWVYQERMLSRRVLYCNQNELQLECREGLVCECGNRFLAPHPHPKTAASRGLGEVKKQYAEAVKKYGVRGKYSAYELCRHWQRTVTQYSRLQLTQARDKLPALSGCARDIGRLTGDMYLAGLWRASLAEGMLWTVNPPIECPRPAAWRAPSWSWASVDVSSGIDYTYALKTRYRQDFQDKIESAECALAGADITGEVSSGYIRVRSRLSSTYLRRLCRQCARGNKAKYTIEHGRWYKREVIKNIDPCKFKTKGLELEDADLKMFPDFKYDDRTDFAFFDAEDGGACKLAPISLLHLYDNQSFESPVVTDFFLVLRPASGKSGDIFERVALATITFGSWARRDTWFESVYRQELTEETLVEIV